MSIRAMVILSGLNWAPYDPAAVKSFVAASKDYALGPDSIVVKLGAGEMKNPDGNLTIPAKYNGDATQWARDWYATGAGDVAGGHVIYST